MTRARLSPTLSRLAFCALLSTSLLATAQPVASLDRLFHSAETRRALDRQRDQGSGAAAESPATPRITINGLVARSSGRRTVWINGAPSDEHAAPAGIALSPRRDDPRLVVVKPDPLPEVTLRVGDTIDRHRGEIIPLAGDSAIAVQDGARYQRK